LLASLNRVNARQSLEQAISIGNDDIGGVVTSTKGPEAGVWVIAETADVPTKFVKIVVTDDDGRYVLPQLPKANYKVWARGYGLVDSPPVLVTPGKIGNLNAAVAPNARAAAEYYPGIYWFSLLRVPDKSEFPGTGPKGNGIPENMKSQGQWLHLVKTDSCWSCHQVGDKATREIPKSLGHFDSSTAAWARRLLSGQAGNNMINGLRQLGPERALAMFADWTDRIARGELKPFGTAKPTSTIPCLMKRDESGSPPGFARVTIQRSAKKGRAILRRFCSRSKRAAGNWPCTIPRRGSSRSLTPVLVPITWYLRRTTTTRCGRGAVAAVER